MLPKVTKSQFRTPFRGHTLSTQSSVCSQTQCPELLLAATPSPAIISSQLSTPGITVDVIKARIRKSPSKKQTTGAKVLKKKLPSKNTDRKNAACRGLSSPPGNSESQNGIFVTFADGGKEYERKNERTHECGRVKNKQTESGTNRCSDTQEYPCPSEAVSYPNHISDFEVVGEGGGESEVIPLQSKIVGNNRGPKEKSMAVRRTIYANNNKPTQQATSLNMAKEVIKKGSVNVAKMRPYYIENWYRANKHYSAEKLMNGKGNDVEAVVIVGEDDYVFKEDPIVSADVYVFPSDSPEGQTPAKIKRTSYRKGKEQQIRLQVLKTIYKMETELAVLRERRKKIRSQLKNCGRLKRGR